MGAYAALSDDDKKLVDLYLIVMALKADRDEADARIKTELQGDADAVTDFARLHIQEHTTSHIERLVRPRIGEEPEDLMDQERNKHAAEIGDIRRQSSGIMALAREFEINPDNPRSYLASIWNKPQFSGNRMF